MMTRRSFLATPVVAGMRATASELRPATLDLREPMPRAAECLINRMDPSMAYQPWFAVDVVNGRPTKLRHDVWDFGDTSGRFVEAFILARQMIQPDPAMIIAEKRIRQFFNSLF